MEWECIFCDPKNMAGRHLVLLGKVPLDVYSHFIPGMQEVAAEVKDQVVPKIVKKARSSTFAV